jgi:hypothetical protein
MSQSTPMKTYICCGTQWRYMFDPHASNCYHAITLDLPRKWVQPPPSLKKCTCGSGNRPLKGAGHSDWCDVER